MLALSRSPLSDEDYREVLREWVDRSSRRGAIRPGNVEAICRRHPLLLRRLQQIRGVYQKVKEALTDYDRTRGTGATGSFISATAPSDYTRHHPQSRGLRACTGIHRRHRFGPRSSSKNRSGATSIPPGSLNQEVSAVFSEDQVYRIDHYLGKETVQNLMVFRFANGIFEPLWNRQYVDNVQITAAEDIGVGTRGGYYEQAGALRDMIQNHMMQLLTLVAMEPPPDFAPNSVRDEKAKVLRSIRPFTPAEARANSVRAQYGPGFIGGKPVPGYLDEKDVAPHIPHRDIRSDPVCHRQLALGRCPLLRAHREEPLQAGHGNRHHVPLHAAPDFRGGRRRSVPTPTSSRCAYSRTKGSR